MSLKKPAVLLTLDSMRFANTGLHTFGHSLGREILRQGQAELDVNAYTYPVQHGFLGHDAGYVRHRKFHRWFFPLRQRFDVVHFTDQYCRFGPARVSGKTIMTVHDLNQIYEQPAGSPKLARHMQRMQVKIAGADRIVAISHFVAADVVNFVLPTVDDSVGQVPDSAPSVPSTSTSRSDSWSSSSRRIRVAWRKPAPRVPLTSTFAPFFKSAKVFAALP